MKIDIAGLPRVVVPSQFFSTRTARARSGWAVALVTGLCARTSSS